MVYAAAETLAVRDVVDAALFLHTVLLTTPPHVEVADVLLNPVRPASQPISPPASKH